MCKKLACSHCKRVVDYEKMKIDFLGVGVGVLMIDWMFFIKMESFLVVVVVGDMIVGVLVDVPFVVDGILDISEQLHF